MATHSSVLAWRIPGTAEPGGLPSMGSHRVWHAWSDLAAAAAAAAGKEQISREGGGQALSPPHPFTLAPRFVNNDYITAEITYSTVHARDKVTTWPQATMLLFCMHVYISSSWKSPWGYVMVALWWWGCEDPHRPTAVSARSTTRGENTDVCCCYGCCASPERINTSAVSTALLVFFQPLSSHLTCPGFSEQCAQWDTAGQFTMPVFPRFPQAASSFWAYYPVLVSFFSFSCDEELLG